MTLTEAPAWIDLPVTLSHVERAAVSDVARLGIAPDGLLVVAITDDRHADPVRTLLATGRYSAELRRMVDAAEGAAFLTALIDDVRRSTHWSTR
jgi:hypothetical protein